MAKPEFVPMVPFYLRSVRDQGLRDVGVDSRGLVAEYGADLAKLVPGLGERGSGAEPELVGEQEDQAALTRLLDRACEFLLRLSETLPLAVMIEDLQWAREGSVRLLEHLWKSLVVREQVRGRVSMALLATCRTDEVAG